MTLSVRSLKPNLHHYADSSSQIKGGLFLEIGTRETTSPPVFETDVEID